MPHLSQSQGKCLTHLLNRNWKPPEIMADPNLSLNWLCIRSERSLKNPTIFSSVALLFSLTPTSMLCRDLLSSSNIEENTSVTGTPWARLNVTTSRSKNTAGLLSTRTIKICPVYWCSPSNLSGMKYSQLLLWFGQQATDSSWERVKL